MQLVHVASTLCLLSIGESPNRSRLRHLCVVLRMNPHFVFVRHDMHSVASSVVSVAG